MLTELSPVLEIVKSAPAINVSALEQLLVVHEVGGVGGGTVDPPSVATEA